MLHRIGGKNDVNHDKWSQWAGALTPATMRRYPNATLGAFWQRRCNPAYAEAVLKHP